MESAEFSGLWPDDEPAKKEDFIRLMYESGHLTPLVDLDGRLAGFLLSYRLPYSDGGYDRKRPESRGEFVSVPLLWLRPELRGRGLLKALFKEALRRKKPDLLGAETIIFERMEKPLKQKRYSFPKFLRKYS